MATRLCLGVLQRDFLASTNSARSGRSLRRSRSRRSGWPDLIVFRHNEFFFAEVKSATDKLGTSQQRWLRDNRERLHFPFKLIEVRKMELEAVARA
jgi:hypothetical protein